MKKRLSLVIVFAAIAMAVLPVRGNAVEMCYSARVQIGTWSDGTRWCSPYRPYSTHCYYPGASNGSTGQTIAVTGEVCYPTRLW